MIDFKLVISDLQIKAIRLIDLQISNVVGGIIDTGITALATPAILISKEEYSESYNFLEEFQSQSLYLPVWIAEDFSVPPGAKDFPIIYRAKPDLVYDEYGVPKDKHYRTNIQEWTPGAEMKKEQSRVSGVILKTFMLENKLYAALITNKPL